MRTLNSINDVWVYDNPDTNMRELFKHGHLITYFSAKSMDRSAWYCLPNVDRFLQEMYYDDMLSLGPWNEGAEYGDRIHKPYDPLANELWSE